MTRTQRRAPLSANVLVWVAQPTPKNRGGRPALAPDEGPSVNFGVRLSPSEVDQVARLAEAQGLTRSAMIRRLVQEALTARSRDAVARSD